MTPEQHEHEAALHRAFVEGRADYIVISSRRQQFQIESANYGVDRGWIAGEWDTRDEQSTAWIGRLTDAGGRTSGLAVERRGTLSADGV